MAQSVDAYLRALPQDRRAALNHIRALCLEELTGFTEAMKHGMPCYLRQGTAEVAFASQKRYISIYVMRTDVRVLHAERLTGQDMGKSCLRYHRPDQIHFDLVQSMLRATAASTGPVC